jgi:membrane protein
MNASFKNLSNDFLDGLIKHDVMTLAAALAFYTTLSLAPILLLTLSLVGLFGIDMSSEVAHEIEKLMGEEAARAITAIVQNAQAETKLSTMAGALGLATLLVSASGVFVQLHSSLNIIWRVGPRLRHGVTVWARHRLLSVVAMFSLALLGIVSVLASTLIAYFFKDYQLTWKVINWFLSLLIFAGVFAALFKYLPEDRLSWRNALVGGLLTSLMFAVGKYVIGVYLFRSAIASAYGAAGSLIMLLLWVYYSSIIFYVGAEVTRVLTNLRAR